MVAKQNLSFGKKCSFGVVLKIAHNGVQVLLQVGYFITVCPVLQLGFVLLMKLRTFAWLYSSSPNPKLKFSKNQLANLIYRGFIFKDLKLVRWNCC